jgi:hypothetical protein
MLINALGPLEPAVLISLGRLLPEPVLTLSVSGIPPGGKNVFLTPGTCAIPAFAAAEHFMASLTLLMSATAVLDFETLSTCTLLFW